MKCVFVFMFIILFVFNFQACNDTAAGSSIDASDESGDYSAENASSAINSSGDISEITDDEVREIVDWMSGMWDDYYDLMNVKLEYDDSVMYSFTNEEGYEFDSYYRVTDKRFQSEQGIKEFLERYFKERIVKRCINICFDYMEVEPNHYAVIDGKLCMLVVDYELDRANLRWEVDFNNYSYKLDKTNLLYIYFHNNDDKITGFVELSLHCPQ